MEGTIKAKARADIVGKFLWRGDDGLQSGTHISVAFLLITGQRARIATQEWQMGLELLTKRHSLTFSRRARKGWK
jgi:hypothetical protein